jgi:hypothetical protein
VYVSPELISDLDSRIRLDLQHASDSFFFWVAVSAIVVAIGCAMEGPELLHDLWPKVFRIFSGKWVKRIGFVGWFLVVLGVAAEGVFEVYDHQASDLLQIFDEVLLTAAQADAGNAKLSAIDASTAARIAREQSGEASASAATARSLAGGARQEADSLTQEITAAKQQSADASSRAADAVSRLTVAESNLADATQRELAAEVEVNRLKTPRSLTNTTNLINSLKPFGGTEYTLNVFADQESIALTKMIGDALDAAGWIRKQPTNHSVGGVQYFNIFSDKFEDSIPSCIEVGVNVHVVSQVPVDVLQSTPAPNLPKEVQAAGVLLDALIPSIAPSDESNVVRVLEVDKDKKPTIGNGPVIVCVGKKP